MSDNIPPSSQPSVLYHLAIGRLLRDSKTNEFAPGPGAYNP